MKRLIICAVYSGAYISCSYNGPIDFKKVKTVIKKESPKVEEVKIAPYEPYDIFQGSSELNI